MLTLVLWPGSLFTTSSSLSETGRLHQAGRKDFWSPQDTLNTWETHSKWGGCVHVFVYVQPIQIEEPTWLERSWELKNTQKWAKGYIKVRGREVWPPALGEGVCTSLWTQRQGLTKAHKAGAETTDLCGTVPAKRDRQENTIHRGSRPKECRLKEQPWVRD